MGIHQQPKEFRDAIPAETWKAVKLAIRQTIAKAGGVEAVAALFTSTKLNPGRVSEWQSLHAEHQTAMPNIWQVAQIEAAAGVDWITEAMCALHNADLVKRGSADAVGAVIERISVAARELGEALSLSATAAANPACRKTAAAFIQEGHEGIRALKELVAAVQAQMGEGV